MQPITKSEIQKYKGIKECMYTLYIHLYPSDVDLLFLG